jgi:hypothetical protein
VLYRFWSLDLDHRVHYFHFFFTFFPSPFTFSQTFFSPSASFLCLLSYCFLVASSLPPRIISSRCLVHYLLSRTLVTSLPCALVTLFPCMFITLLLCMLLRYFVASLPCCLFCIASSCCFACLSPHAFTHLSPCCLTHSSCCCFAHSSCHCSHIRHLVASHAASLPHHLFRSLTTLLRYATSSPRCVALLPHCVVSLPCVLPLYFVALLHCHCMLPSHVASLPWVPFEPPICCFVASLPYYLIALLVGISFLPLLL